MAIDDNTVYGLTGAQVKELPGKIEAVKGLAKIPTTDDYNWPTDNPDGIAAWLLDSGLYDLTGLKVYASTESTSTSFNTVLLHHFNDGRYRMVRIEGDNTMYLTIGDADHRDFTNYVMTITSPYNDLNSTSTIRPLAANQGRILKNLVDGNLGRAKELTTSDYNYPTTGTPLAVALWLLEPGEYHWAQGVQTKTNSSASTTSAGGAVVTKDSSYAYLILTNSSRVGITVTSLNDGSQYRSLQDILVASDIVQSTGTSTTSVMSQKATTGMVYADKASSKIAIDGTCNANGPAVSIGDGCVAGYICTAIGYSAKAMTGQRAVALGSGALATANRSIALGGATAAAENSVAVGASAYAHIVGQFDIGAGGVDGTDTKGYNSSAYRLLTGLYDGQSNHDAATYGQLKNAIINGGTTAPTTATVGAVGTLYSAVVSNTAHLYVCTAIDDTTDPQNPSYTWTTLV